MDTKDKLIADLIAALVTAKVDLKSKAPDAPYRHKKTAAIVAHALDKAYAAGYGPAS